MATREELLQQLNELKAMRQQLVSEQGSAQNVPSFKEGATPRTWGDTLDDVTAGAVGLSEGYLKGLPQVVTRPLDLVVRGGNYLAEAMGAEPVDITNVLPTNLWKSGVDALVGDTPSSKTMQGVGEVAGIIPGMVMAPSAFAPAMTATKGMSMLPRAATVGTAMAPEGAAWGAAFEAANENPDYIKGASTGAGLNMALGAAGPMAAEAAKDLKGADGFAGLMGYKPEAAKKVAGGVDAAGNVTQDAGQAVAQVSKKDIKLQELRDSGFLNTIKATDGPQDVSLKLWQFQQNAGKTIGDTVDMAAQAEQQLSMQAGNESMGWWKSMDDYVNQPKNVGSPEAIANAAPDFSGSQEFVDAIMASDPVTAARLQNRLDSVKAAWDSSDQSLMTFKNMQENLGITGKSTFNPAKSTADNLSDSLNNIMYGEVASSLKNRIATIGEMTGNPELAKQFAEANKAYSSAVTFKDSAFQASRQSMATRAFPAVAGQLARKYLPTAAAGYGTAGTLGATVATGGAVVANALPVQAMKAVQGAQTLMELTSKVPMGNSAIAGFNTILPRNWDEVKNDPKALAGLAQKAGILFSQFSLLPEAAQAEIFTQVVATDPNSAVPVPGNYTVVNGKFLNPMERDFYVRENLDKSPAERALAVGPALTNKYTPPQASDYRFGKDGVLEMSTGSPLPDIDLPSLSSGMDEAMSGNPPQQSSDLTSMLNQLTNAEQEHFLNDYGIVQ